jgi:FKBP12-rapamycin complex-associated protein
MAQDPTAAPGGPPSSRPRARTNSTTQGAGGAEVDVQETQNERAMQVLNRVKEKLTGRDFKPDEELTYILQVDKLLIEATKLENLCQHYIGWCSFW